MLVIVDYGASNLRSVQRAFEAIGETPVISSRPDDLAQASAIVLPGVGAFGDGMQRLTELGLIVALNEQVLVRKKPYLGICLGLQYLASRSEEHGSHLGLGWLEAEVRQIQPADPACRIPHMGWNDVQIHRASPLFEGIEPGACFYFVHSFALQCEDAARAAVVGTCCHGTEIVAAIQRENIFGVQFHPEKSQRHGLQLLENFVRYTKLC